MRLARLAVALLACLSIAFPAQADGPGPYKIYLPTIAGCDMTTYATFEISDGDVTIDLLRGNIHLSDWKPAIPQLKGGGIWQDSALATGRRMVDRRFGNVSDSLSLVVSSPEQDDTIREIGDLLHLLEKARDFTASSWQSDPVWIKRQAGCETNPTYALLFDYKIPQLSNPYAAPFAAASQLATMSNFTLSMEHSIWLSCRPGVGECVQASGIQNNWVYTSWAIVNANVTFSLMQSDTGRIFAGQLGNIMQSDDDGATWVLSTAAPAIGITTLFQTASGRILAVEAGNIWKSDNDGVAWAAVAVPPGAAIRSMIQLASGRLMLGCTSDVYYSDNNGENWTAFGISRYNGNLPALLLTTTGRVLATGFGEIWYTDNQGMTWGTIATGFFGSSIPSILQLADSRILAGGIGPNLWISSDDGATWSNMGLSSVAGAYVFGLMQASDGLVYLTAGGVYSSDDLFTWKLGVIISGGQTLSIIETDDKSILVGDEQLGGNLYRLGAQAETSLGRPATCNDEVFIANKQNIANLTDIYVSDGGVFGPNLFPISLPGHVHLLPAVPVVNDAVYFGIDSTIANSGPFESLIFDLYDIINYDNSYTITWEYSNGAAGWPALTVQDGTNPGTGAFRTLGVSSIHWTPPAAWATEAVNGVTGWWVRARVSALVGTMTSPSQQNRNIYTVVLPYSDIAAAQVGGDIPALAQVKLHNRSDKDGRAGSGPNLWDNRVIIGLRSYDRGPTFTAYLNASDEQNPAGVTVTLGANTTVPAGISGITGKLCTWAAALADTTFTDRVTFTLGPTIARDFYGSFHAFLRAGVTSGSSSDIHARLQVRTGSGGVTLTSVDDYLKGTTDYEVLDLGRVSIPASGLLSFDDLGDSTVLAVQLRNDSGAARTVYIHDLILIPVDECAIDATDYANITLSVVGRTSSTPHLLDFDSLTYHKVDVRTLARTADGNGFVTSVYVPGGGPMVLQANARQRLWAFAMQTSATGITYVWLASPWIAHSVQVRANERWLGLRGDR